MSTRTHAYKRHRFPPDIMQHAVWFYSRFNPGHRDIEDLLAQRGGEVSRESIQLWCNKFGPEFARRLRRAHQSYGDTFFLDEVFVKIQGKRLYLWRAVTHDGEVVDVFLQARRDGKAAKRFYRRLLKRHGDESRRIVTDKLRSYGVALRELIPEAIHDTSQYANNRAEVFHQPTRVRQRGMRRFKSRGQAQRFLAIHAAVYNLFNPGRHLTAARHNRELLQRAFASWAHAVAARDTGVDGILRPGAVNLPVPLPGISARYSKRWSNATMPSPGDRCTLQLSGSRLLATNHSVG